MKVPKPPKIPKDLGLKMTTKDGSIWLDVAKACRVSIENCEKELVIQREILQLAEKRIAEEKAKLDIDL